MPPLLRLVELPLLLLAVEPPALSFPLCGKEFRVSGFRVQGSGFRIQGGGFKVEGEGHSPRKAMLHMFDRILFLHGMSPFARWTMGYHSRSISANFACRWPVFGTSVITRPPDCGGDADLVQGYLAHKIHQPRRTLQ